MDPNNCSTAFDVRHWSKDFKFFLYPKKKKKLAKLMVCLETVYLVKIENFLLKV